MKRRIIIPLISGLLFLTQFSFGQAWSGIIDPGRAVDWSQAGVTGGIPNRTTVCASLTSSATSAQINSAIAACPAGQVVSLAAGTYSLASGITFNGHSNVTLRGAGPTKTILNFSGGDGCGGLGGDVCMISNPSSYNGSANIMPGGSNSANWTAGYAQGATQITLDKAPAVGKFIILDQASDTSDTGGLFICNLSSCNAEGAVSAPGRNVSGNTRSQQQIVNVTAVSGSGPYTVTISPGLYLTNWRASQSPGAWWPGQLTMAGLENVTVNNAASSANSGIYIFNCYNCWVKNVKSLNGNRNHVWLYQAAHIEVRDSYFYGTHNGAEESYGIEPYQTSDSLIENNIFDSISSPDISGDSQGVVWAYNFTTKNTFNPNPNWMQVSYSSHNTANLMNLFEGNQMNALFCDDDWGTSGLGTVFRNKLDGAQPGKSLNTNALRIDRYCRGYNIIGNVLGTAGYDTQYEVSAKVGSTGPCDSTVYNLGFPSTECKGTSDPLVASTLYRWGNYDNVHGSVQWNSSEVPANDVPYLSGNAVPADHNLPPSFYLSAKPPFWGSMPWPAIGPDVTGGSDTSGHSYPIPAQVCFNAGSFTSGIMNFDSTNCYGSGGGSTNSPPPAPPTNLSITVQ